MTIKFLGVWDTVGALGIPLNIFRSANNDRYQFHDTSISSTVGSAYHALDIDEKRKAFTPTIWLTKKERERTEQSWFAGVHSDIRGGYRKAGLSHIALQWMAVKANMSGLELDENYLSTLYRHNNETQLHNSYKGPMRALGSLRRPIAATNSDETLHISAEQRFCNDRKYGPKNLGEYLAQDEQTRLPL